MKSHHLVLTHAFVLCLHPSSRPRPTGHLHTPSRTMYEWMPVSAYTTRCMGCRQEGKQPYCSDVLGSRYNQQQWVLVGD
jgi:hypothetical protein